nr:MAG TPA: hypothetical protein [Caudoviricetes sp.]
MKIIFLMCCGDNKGLEPYKYKERQSYKTAFCLLLNVFKSKFR